MLPKLTGIKWSCFICILFGLILVLHLLFLFFIELPDREVGTSKLAAHSKAQFGVNFFGDEGGYVHRAYNLANKKIYSINGITPSAMRVPVWPLLLTPIFFFTNNIIYGFILNALLASLISLGAYFLAKLYWGRETGLLTMIVVGLSPHTYNWMVELNSETIFSLLLILFLISFTYLIKYHNLKQAALAGLLAGLIPLTRPEGILLFPLYAMYLVYIVFTEKRHNYLVITVFCLTFFLTVSPWFIRNYLVMDKFIGISTLSGIVFAGAHNEKIFHRSPGSWAGPGFYLSKEEIAHLTSLRQDEAKYNSYLWQKGLENLKKVDFSFLLYLELRKILNLIKPSFRIVPKSYSELINTLIVAPYFILYVTFFAFIFLGRSIIIKKYAALFLILVIPLAVTLIFFGDVRFRVPYEPVIFTLAIGFLANERRFIPSLGFGRSRLKPAG